MDWTLTKFSFSITSAITASMRARRRSARSALGAVRVMKTTGGERKEKGSITSKLISPLKDTSPSKFSEQKAQQNKLELLKKFDSRGLKDGEPRKVKIKIIKCNSTQKNQEEKADEKSQKNPIVLKKVKKQLDKSMPRIVGIPSLNDHRCSNHASYSA